MLQTSRASAPGGISASAPAWKLPYSARPGFRPDPSCDPTIIFKLIEITATCKAASAIHWSASRGSKARDVGVI